jgi:hypothetical protein
MPVPALCGGVLPASIEAEHVALTTIGSPPSFEALFASGIPCPLWPDSWGLAQLAPLACKKNRKENPRGALHGALFAPGALCALACLGGGGKTWGTCETKMGVLCVPPTSP